MYCDDGYCPESLLQGKKVKMKINESDFWESPETGLQIMGWDPLYAVVLPFRGKGKFKDYQSAKPEMLHDLLLIHSGEKGKHFLPQDNEYFTSKEELEAYVRESVFATEDEYEVSLGELNKH